MGWISTKKEELKQALRGLVGQHQRMFIAAQLEHIYFLDRQIARLSEEIAKRMRPFEEELALLATIPGVGRRSAEEILAETGTDMERFPTAAHLSSWGGEGSGQQRKRRQAKKRPHQKRQQGLTRHPDRGRPFRCPDQSHLPFRQHHRIAARRGANRAAIALAHAILLIAYYILKRRQPYVELGPDYLDERKKQAMVRRTVKKLQDLGYEVRIEPKVALPSIARLAKA